LLKKKKRLKKRLKKKQKRDDTFFKLHKVIRKGKRDLTFSNLTDLERNWEYRIYILRIHNVK
jgi:hypothetical protein